MESEKQVRKNTSSLMNCTLKQWQLIS